ncbi:response regulator [Herbaspirillum seropedicae]|uniref:Response regulator consisting of a CheY-like receiver domain and a winged-helix DNA-binding domain protein n=1 Tax=Herbaspirillum seropedicae (strain SmR1) TaxID=757424 RepID=D8J289_HERSS|nr:response regulator [Herbaspirillum seropedicae]ADJ64872.1 response regulator consisting of a CheY-like receiver domain and a winged-helix DNA-binding domain protein [Herbaspirillum seropedicae SmR1]AKN66774.1 transcriptional regulator [Herbaspirillum seropedicae]AON55664.1 response regulator [Herbaspirillum seropedicae]MDR6395109.1 DNA-binding response OmpR family regulator [Herbaspirillum seropedicae]NQE28232.1 transcriptional regulator [Herbaspirillum seropedicae]
MKLLLIEDNPQLAHWLEQILKEHKFKVDIAADGEIADQVLRDENYDVVLLDLMLPKLHGKNVLRRLRERHNGVPVMILTASGSIDEKVECLGAGADDYLVKPFEIRELVARIKVLVRRQTPDKAAEIHCGNLVYDSNTRQFAVGGVTLALPAREHDVLEVLILRQGKTVSKTALMKGVFSLSEEPSADAIEVYISRLRKKLDRSGAAIMTLRGLGYLLRQRD